MTTPRSACSGPRWQRATLPTRRAWAMSQRPCALCGDAIDYRLRYPDKLALTVDHITPLWAGGAAYDPTNWQPAHQTCNSRRGAIEGNRQRNRPKGTSAPWK